jgi:dihydropteroate synthase
MAFSPRLLRVVGEANALAELTRIGTDPEHARLLAGRLAPRLVKLSAVPCRAATILQQEMLACGGDAALTSGSAACAIPSTDVILIGSVQQLRILAQRLQAQSGGLRELAAELTTLLQQLAQPPRWLAGRSCRLRLDQPRLMGIINVTPDSFSDGGRYADLAMAVAHGRQLAAEGADLLDVGGESTRPGAAAVSTQEEIDRVVPVIEALVRELALPVSVDTNKSDVARAAVAAGADFINDISGLQFDPGMARTAAESGAGLFLMHTRGRPATMQQQTDYADLRGEVFAGLQRSLELARAAGVAEERLAIDPGIGFGKNLQGNLELMRHLAELHSLGRPLLLGTSRKSFIGTVLGIPRPEDRLNGTLATVAAAVSPGVQLLRVHEVKPAREVALMAHAIFAGAVEQDMSNHA